MNFWVLTAVQWWIVSCQTWNRLTTKSSSSWTAGGRTNIRAATSRVLSTSTMQRIYIIFSSRPRLKGTPYSSFTANIHRSEAHVCQTSSKRQKQLCTTAHGSPMYTSSLAGIAVSSKPSQPTQTLNSMFLRRTQGLILSGGTSAVTDNIWWIFQLPEN